MRTCTRRIGIDAGHRVTRHESKCKSVHGHRYEIEITVEAADIDEAGRIVDFGRVKEEVGGWLMEKLDHGYIAAPWDRLADGIEAEGLKVFRMPESFGEPTAENLAALIGINAQTILDPSLKDLVVSHVRVYETPNCWADWTNNWRVAQSAATKAQAIR